MASGTRRVNSESEPLVFSDVHAGHPCIECFLCKESPVVYTHPVKWKNDSLFTFVKGIRPDIMPQSCICRNCRDNLAGGQKDPTNYHPRWIQRTDTKLCEVPECDKPASRSTKLGDRALLSTLFNCSDTASDQTNLCSSHYRVLHRELNPGNYQWNCIVCSTPVRASSYRTCSEREIFQSHLREHTDFSGSITTTDKLCMPCYRYSLAVVKMVKEKPITTDSDLAHLVTEIQNSLPTLPLQIDEESKLLDIALGLTVLSVAHDLQENRAITLLSAHSRFLSNIEILLSMCTFQHTSQKKTHRWLLGQLSTQLKHHMSYTCIVKKHGVFIYRQGRELHALSHTMYSARASTKAENLQVVRSKIQQLIQTTLETTSTAASLDLDRMIKNIDPDIWDTICILTMSGAGGNRSDSLVKKTRRLFILHQIMFCIDSRCSMPFHLLNADMIDCFGGSAELLRILNRLGVCVSQDTLLRHIHSAVAEQQEKGLLQGLDPAGITMFTMDNVDFLHSHAQVYSGNQKSLSWHGTTVQAVQTKPSLNPISTSLYTIENRRRSHALLSPMNSPDSSEYVSKRIRGRARTGTELQCNNPPPTSSSYNFHSQSLPSSDEPVKSIAMSDFRPSDGEQISIGLFKTKAFAYCLVKNALPSDKQKELLGFQEFLSISTNTPTPEVGYAKYIEVLDELADSAPKRTW